MRKIKLFCIPYAGGSATEYLYWKELIHKMIEVYPVEISGRGSRFCEKIYESIADIADDLFDAIKSELDGSSYAFFGHSMGSMLIYELMKRINQAGYKEPVHIIFSGRFPPHISEKNIFYKLDNTSFKKEIIKLGGIPKQVYSNTKILDEFIPIIRADYRAVETYEFIESEKWSCNISVFMGQEDKENFGEIMREWKDYTNGKCEFFEFEGTHFFIKENMQLVVEKVNEVVLDSYFKSLGINYK